MEAIRRKTLYGLLAKPPAPVGELSTNGRYSRKMQNWMLLWLPVEIVFDIIRLSPVASQAALARTCHALHGICNKILYGNDSRYHGSAAISHAINCYVDQKVVIGTLQAAAAAGASLERCQAYLRRMEAPRQVSRLQICAPIYLAASRGLDDVVAFLINCGVSIEGLSGASISPFWGAVLAGKEKTALMLLQHGASETSTIEGLDAFHASIQYGLSDLADYLVNIRKMDVNRKTKSGATPIMLAFSSRRGAMVQKLLQLGANVQYRKTSQTVLSRFSMPLRYTLEGER